MIERKVLSDAFQEALQGWQPRAAVFLTFAHGITRPRRQPVRDPVTGETQTLEARRTADGWVIEI